MIVPSVLKLPRRVLGLLEVRTVENMEELGAELHAPTLGEKETLAAHVPILKDLTIQTILPPISERSDQNEQNEFL